ncbi:hypothetical protein SM139_1409 [Stenotrophomonas maltophilia]|nr:hypothetical protein SM139_1409 [Stenotrophomonas maltophilia]
MTLPVRPAVLVIGASAGGVAALQAVLGALPAKLPVPVLAVLHLPRDRTSRIAEVLAPYCALPVREAEDKQPLQPGTVTFAPPDYHLLVEDEGGGGVVGGCTGAVFPSGHRSAVRFRCCGVRRAGIGPAADRCQQ